MTKSTLSTLGSILFMVASLIIVFLIWNGSSKVQSVEQYSNTESYAPVDISSLKTQAVKIISGYQNNASIPIPVPVAKMGKTNPFTDPE
jgi:hypothetical protein